MWSGHSQRPPLLQRCKSPIWFDRSHYSLSADRTSLPIQIYLSWRIRIFSGSTRVFVFLAALATIQTILGFVCSIMAFLAARWGKIFLWGAEKLNSWEASRTFGHWYPLWLHGRSWQWHVMLALRECTMIESGSTTFNDPFSLLLGWYLNKSRTGSQSSVSYFITATNTHLTRPTESDHIITRVIKSSVETAAFGAFFCVSSQYVRYLHVIKSDRDVDGVGNGLDYLCTYAHCSVSLFHSNKASDSTTK